MTIPQSSDNAQLSLFRRYNKSLDKRSYEMTSKEKEARASFIDRSLEFAKKAVGQCLEKVLDKPGDLKLEEIAQGGQFDSSAVEDALSTMLSNYGEYPVDVAEYVRGLMHDLTQTERPTETSSEPTKAEITGTSEAAVEISDETRKTLAAEELVRKLILNVLQQRFDVEEVIRLAEREEIKLDGEKLRQFVASSIDDADRYLGAVMQSIEISS